MNTIIASAVRQARVPATKIAVPAIYIFRRTFASPSNSTPPSKNEPKSTDAAPNRQPPTVLGVKERPVPDRNSWVGRQKKKIQDLTDYDKAFASHVEERRYLVAEATKSYFADAHEMREHGGKLYEASNKLIRAEKALYMPDFEGQNFKKDKIHTTDMLQGKISLMSFVLAQYAEQHVNSFINPFLTAFKERKDVQLVELNVQENLLKQYLMKALLGTIKKNTPLERQDNYVLLYKDISRLRRYLGMSNQYIGYIFLVDENCKIRWTAHGMATPQELQNLIGMTKFLAEKKATTEEKSQ
ncbi:ATPase assembly factor ATP10 [Umbelopsis sp. PMI_123]|nr:ATPase assembly factor ATP10 [Umbelopsis sp. PMI_123]